LAFQRECSETSQLDTVAAGERRSELVENRSYDHFYETPIQTGISFGQMFYELAFCHFIALAEYDLRSFASL
jgi:hypothetical protein